jgi:hypothetical protein
MIRQRDGTEPSESKKQAAVHSPNSESSSATSDGPLLPPPRHAPVVEIQTKLFPIFTMSHASVSSVPPRLNP